MERERSPSAYLFDIGNTCEILLIKAIGTLEHPKSSIPFTEASQALCKVSVYVCICSFVHMCGR